MAKDKAVVGIDLGATKMLVGALRGSRVLATVKAKTDPAGGLRRFLDGISAAVEEVLSRAEIRPKQLAAVGVGCPGVIDYRKNRIRSSANIPFLINFPLAKRLERIFGTPTTVENDANMGLYGEQQFGAAAGYRHVAGFFMGTGIGGALILDGTLYRGSSGAAGELGHLFIDPLGPGCGCGNRGCLEAAAGRLAIAAEAAALACRGRADHLLSDAGSDLRKLKSGALARAVKAGDDELRQLLRRKAQLVGIGMANVVNTLDPECIVLGGGLMEAMPQLILPAAEQSMRGHAMPDIAEHVKVAAAELGDLAIVMGAAKWALDHAGS
ncbi:MAG TPA: transcriptional regulator [Elusimicrobia bacterium]|nr:transcriptional regulator [Elusimicrobiota bacterium]HBT61631.1 transcriptional regulator [Elusimicrobiota bacterium]